MAATFIKLTPESRRAIRRSAERGQVFEEGMVRIATQAGVLMSNAIAVSEFGPGRTLENVTGTLRSSIASRVQGATVTGLAIRVGVTKGPATRYASIHERGGVIEPVNKKYLAIPLEKTSGGRPKFPTPASAAAKFGEKNVIVIKSKKGNLLIVRLRRVSGSDRGKVIGIEPLFVLKKSVKIPARRWLSGGVRRNIGDMRSWMQNEVDQLLGAS